MNNKSVLNVMHQEDTKILGFLRKNARQTLTKISKDAGIPISTVFDRLKKMEETGVIKKHTCLLNMEKIGFNVQVYLLIKTSENQANELEKYLMENPNVNSMVKINGNWNFIVEALFRDINSLELFVDDVKNDFKGITISVHYVLEDIKRESFLVDNDRKLD